MFDQSILIRIMICLVFFISLMGLYFLKRMKIFAISYIVMEIGLAVIVASITIIQNPWGGIGYFIFGLYILGIALITGILFSLYKLIRWAFLKNKRQK